KPLREALDWLRDAVGPLFEKKAGGLFKNPWQARDGYIDVILNRTPENIDAFFDRHAAHRLGAPEQVEALQLMELQRNALLMYTSCGWFCDEISGLETVQVIQYAGRVIQLAADLFGENLEEGFLKVLERAPSNIKEYGNGRVVYERFVKPATVTREAIGAHYAVSSLFESYAPLERIFCYGVEREDFQMLEAGRARLVVGRARMTSEITRESALLSFGAIHFGDHHVNGGVRPFESPEDYAALVWQLTEAFQRADFSELVRLLDRGFGEATYSLRSLFRDEQRKITKRVL